MTDEETIRSALAEYQSRLATSTDHPDYADEAAEAVAALGRIVARSIPALPDGWLYCYVEGPAPELQDEKWRVGIRQLHNERCLVGQGPTFRAACVAAIARITEEKS